MFLVRRHIFGRHEIPIAQDLSSNNLRCTIGYSKKTSKPNVLVYLMNPIIGNKYLNECDKETYSASLEDSEMTVFSL